MCFYEQGHYVVTSASGDIAACEPFAGTCTNGKLSDQALRTSDDECGACDFGFILQTTPNVTTTTIDPYCLTDDATVVWVGNATNKALHTTISADFGAQSFAPRWDVPVVFEDSLGCVPLKNVSGGAVAIMRGTCTFWEKTLNAQRAGAEFCIIYDSELLRNESVTRMVCKEAGCAAITIPVLYLDFASGQALKAAARGSSGEAVGRPTTTTALNLACDGNGTARTTTEQGRPTCMATTTTTTTTITTTTATSTTTTRTSTTTTRTTTTATTTSALPLLFSALASIAAARTPSVGADH